MTKDNSDSQGAAQAAPDQDQDQCSLISVSNEAWRVTLRWQGMIDKSHWRDLVGTGWGNTYKEACEAAVEAAKASRLA